MNRSEVRRWLPALALGALATALAGAAGPAIDLAAIPRPDLTAVEPLVADHIRAERTRLERLAVDPGAGSGALALGLGRLGMVYHAYAFGAAAGACYRAARGLAPAEFRWAYLEGHLHEENGAAGAAAAAFRDALSLRGGDVPTLVRLGTLELRAGRPEEAAGLFERALAADPAAALALEGLGQVALAAGDAATAVARFEAALAAAPQAAQLHYPLAQAYRQLGESERAADHLARFAPVPARLRDPLAAELGKLARGARLLLIEGTRLYREGQTAAAAERFAEAALRDPQMVEAQLDLGTALASLGDAGAAMDRFRRALALDPRSAAGHYNLGVLLARVGHMPAALDHLRAAVAADPSDADAWSQLARAARATGRAAEARAAYARRAELEGTAEWRYLGEALILQDLGRWAAVRTALEEGHRALPEAGRLAHALARLLAAAPDPSLRDGERALGLAQRVLAARPTVEHAATVVLALAEVGRCGEAARWQERLIAATARPGPGAGDLERELARYRAGPPCRPPPSPLEVPPGDTEPASLPAPAGSPPSSPRRRRPRRSRRRREAWPAAGERE